VSSKISREICGWMESMVVSRREVNNRIHDLVTSCISFSKHFVHGLTFLLANVLGGCLVTKQEFVKSVIFSFDAWYHRSSSADVTNAENSTVTGRHQREIIFRFCNWSKFFAQLACEELIESTETIEVLDHSLFELNSCKSAVSLIKDRSKIRR
jgi:hypothetical protein